MAEKLDTAVTGRQHVYKLKGWRIKCEAVIPEASIIQFEAAVPDEPYGHDGDEPRETTAFGLTTSAGVPDAPPPTLEEPHGLSAAAGVPDAHTITAEAGVSHLPPPTLEEKLGLSVAAGVPHAPPPTVAERLGITASAGVEHAPLLENAAAPPAASAPASAFARPPAASRLAQSGVAEAAAVLTELRVTGATEKGSFWWEVQNDDDTIELEAVTDPPDAAGVVWTGAGLSPGSSDNKKLIARRAVGRFQITAALGGATRAVDVRVVDLTALTSTLADKGDRVFKGYVDAGKSTIVTATTNPADADTWGLLAWTGGVRGDDDHLRAVSLDAAGDVEVTATLGARHPKSLALTVHVCAWPVLSVKLVDFSGGYTVMDDDAKLCDNEWEHDRHPDQQSPVCYARNTKPAVKVTFAVTTRPTDDEVVKVRGTSTFGGTLLTWASTSPHVTVAHDADEVVVDLAASDANLPDVVACYADQAIAWEATTPADAWKKISDSTHTFYVTLGAPRDTAHVYWTLLDLSCRAATGKSAAADVMSTVFARFTDNVGPDVAGGKQITRKGDDKQLTYYKTTDPVDIPDIFDVAEMLSDRSAEGRCRAWAELLKAILEMHGIAGAAVKGVKLRAAVKNARQFIVKNLTFTNADGSRDSVPFSHHGVRDVRKDDGLPGQGTLNPIYTFPDHAIVQYGGKLYDPSYGTGPFDTLAQWEAAAIAGVGRRGNLADGDGIRPETCSPGFVTHTVVADETWDTIATTYSVADGATLRRHTYNDPLRAVIRDRTPDTPRLLAVGDVVYVPRAIGTIVMTELVDPD